jgi:hypothetical protein
MIIMHTNSNKHTHLHLDTIIIHMYTRTQLSNLKTRQWMMDSGHPNIVDNRFTQKWTIKHNG